MIKNWRQFEKLLESFRLEKKKKTSRSTKFNVKFFARVFLKKDTSELRLHFVFTHKGLSVKRGIGVGVGVFFLLKNAVLWLGLGLS